MGVLVALRVVRGLSAADESEVHFRNWMQGSVVPCEEPLPVANRGTAVGQLQPDELAD